MSNKKEIRAVIQDVRKKVGALYYTSIFFVFLSGLFEGLSLLFLVPLLNAIMPSAHTSHPHPYFYERIPYIATYLVNPYTVFSLFIITSVTQYSLMLLQYYYSSKAQEKYVWTWRKLTIENLLRARWSHFSQINDHETSNIILTTLPKLGLVVWNLIQVVSTVISIVVYMAIALFISWQVTLLMLVVGGVLLPVVMRYINAAKKVGDETNTLETELNGWCLEMISGIKFIKSSGTESYALSLFKGINDKLSSISSKSFFQSNAIVAVYQGTMLIMLVLSLLLSIKVLGVHFVNVLITIALFSRLYPRYTLFNTYMYTLKLNLHGLEKIESLNREAQVNYETAGKVPQDREHEELTKLEMKQVSIGYEGSHIIKDATFKIERGDFIAIIGESGVGKTTLVDALLGLVAIDSGEICLNDANLCEEGFARIREMTGYVSQDAILFNTSIAKNISWGEAEPNEALIKKAAKLADAHEYILNTSEGYQTVIGDRGEKLSGGQRQRLAIARALYHDKKILILDEATSALDKNSEDEILKTIHALKGEVTIIMITHKFANAESADKIYSIQSGRIVQLEHGAGREPSGTEVESLEVC